MVDIEGFVHLLDCLGLLAGLGVFYYQLRVREIYLTVFLRGPRWGEEAGHAQGRGVGTFDQRRLMV
jgi:hypothetical protein